MTESWTRFGRRCKQHAPERDAFGGLAPSSQHTCVGLGLFFDDPVHELMGRPDDAFQSLYHFTVGGPREDARLATRAAYPHLEAPAR